MVHAKVSVETELLILLHSYYPDAVPVVEITKSLSRRSEGTVKQRLRDLHAAKLAQGDVKSGYQLTQAGHAKAVKEIQSLGA